MRRPRLLLLSVSAGAGHMRAAEALKIYAESEFGAEARHLDVMDYVPASFRAVYVDTYLRIVARYPMLWAMLYRIADRKPRAAPLQQLRRAVERLNARTLRKVIADYTPDAIVCTHFLPADLMRRELERNRLACPVWVQVTDFDLHALWVVPGLTGYFAASDEVAQRMHARGLPPERVHASGIPIMPTFAQPLDRTACAAAFGLDPTRSTVLLMGGGAGLGGLEDVAERLLALDPRLQLIALAGRNATTLTALESLAARHPGRLFPQGFTERVAELMAASDLAVTKPGGLTTSECLARGLPMIVHAPIPGQEERNCDYLLEQGAALKALDATALDYRIALLLREPQRLAAMRERAAALGRPHAARAVLGTVFATR